MSYEKALSLISGGGALLVRNHEGDASAISATFNQIKAAAEGGQPVMYAFFDEEYQGTAYSRLYSLVALEANSDDPFYMACFAGIDENYTPTVKKYRAIDPDADMTLFDE